jgi:glutathione S-transferase
MAELGLKYETYAIGPRTGNQDGRVHQAQPSSESPDASGRRLLHRESAAIVAYLARTYGTQDVSLIPDDKRAYAKWLEWCFFIVTELDLTSLYVMRRHSEGALGHIYGVAPNVTAKAGEYFVNNCVMSKSRWKTDAAFLMGDQFTSADILLTTCLEWAIAYSRDLRQRTPYLERIKTRPGYLARECCERSAGSRRAGQTASGLINNTQTNAPLAGHFLISTIASPERPLKRRMSDAVYLGMRTALFATI